MLNDLKPISPGSSNSRFISKPKPFEIFNEAYTEAQSVLAVEQRVGKERRCPHCGTAGAYKNGITHGLKLYRCAKGCGRTFKAVSDSP